MMTLCNIVIVILSECHGSLIRLGDSFGSIGITKVVVCYPVRDGAWKSSLAANQKE